MAEAELMKKRKNVWDTISDLIDQGRKPSKYDMKELFDLGQPKDVLKAVAKKTVPSIEITKGALIFAKNLRKGLDEAARHDDSSLLNDIV